MSMLALAYGRSGQRITCPHDGEAVPSSAVNITIQDEGGTEKLASTAATKGTLDTTLAAAAAQGDRSVTVAAVTGATIDDAVALTDAAGRVELAVITGVDTTAKVLYLDRRLQRDYAIGDDVDSAAIYYDADISDTDDWPKGIYYQAIFTCADWKKVRALVFRIVDKATGNPITYEDIERALPHVSILQDSYDLPDLQRPRDLAWEMLSAELEAGGVDPETIRDPQRIGRAGGLLAAAFFLMSRRGALDLAHEIAGEPIGTGGVFAVQWERVLRTLTWVDRDQDAIREWGETLSPRDRGRRMTRGL